MLRNTIAGPPLILDTNERYSSSSKGIANRKVCRIRLTRTGSLFVATREVWQRIGTIVKWYGRDGFLPDFVLVLVLVAGDSKSFRGVADANQRSALAGNALAASRGQPMQRKQTQRRTTKERARIVVRERERWFRAVETFPALGVH